MIRRKLCYENTTIRTVRVSFLREGIPFVHRIYTGDALSAGDPGIKNENGGPPRSRRDLLVCQR